MILNISSSNKELTLLFLLICIAGLLFSSFVYFIESDQEIKSYLTLLNKTYFFFAGRHDLLFYPEQFLVVGDHNDHSGLRRHAANHSGGEGQAIQSKIFFSFGDKRSIAAKK